MTIYLYKKTHNKTGLKYLGKTTFKDPHKYQGSGKRWTNHIKTHGYDVTTEILRECKNTDELKQWGKYYSSLWDIVESEEWANLKPEEGDGGAHANSGAHMKLESYKEMVRIRNSKDQFRKDLIHRMTNNNPMNNEEYRKKIGDALRGVPKSEEHKKNMFNPMLDPKISGQRKGKNSPIYDHTVYCFHHKDGRIEECTQRELIEKYTLNKGNVNTMIHHPDKLKSVSGWYITKP